MDSLCTVDGNGRREANRANSMLVESFGRGHMTIHLMQDQQLPENSDRKCKT